MIQPRGSARRDDEKQAHLEESAGVGRPLIGHDKNLMPSMVVRQQKGQLHLATEARSSSSSSSSSGQQHQQQPNRSSNNNNNNNNCETQTTLELLNKSRLASAQEQSGLPIKTHTFDRDGLILPRRLLHQNPQLLARPAGGGEQVNTIRDLNRELKFNQARGKNVLEQKSELKRAMEKLEASRRKKEAEQERLGRRSSLELRLEERAQRLACQSSPNSNPSGPTKQTTNPPAQISETQSS